MLKQKDVRGVNENHSIVYYYQAHFVVPSQKSSTPMINSFYPVNLHKMPCKKVITLSGNEKNIKPKIIYNYKYMLI